jgi:hypothetical protein
MNCLPTFARTAFPIGGYTALCCPVSVSLGVYFGVYGLTDDIVFVVTKASLSTGKHWSAVALPTHIPHLPSLMLVPRFTLN